MGADDYSRDWKKRRDDENALTGMATDGTIGKNRSVFEQAQDCQLPVMLSSQLLQNVHKPVVKPQKRVVFWVE